MANKKTTAKDSKEVVKNDKVEVSEKTSTKETGKTTSKTTDKAAKKNLKGSKTEGKKEPKEPKESLVKKARSGNPAKRGEVLAAAGAAKSAKPTKPGKAGEAIKLSKSGLNPAWLVPTMVGLMVIGIAWVVIFYLSASIGGYPIPALKYGNLVAGFGFIIAGFILSTKWK
jgi:hypothetical protein